MTDTEADNMIEEGDTVRIVSKEETRAKDGMPPVGTNHEVKCLRNGMVHIKYEFSDENTIWIFHPSDLELVEKGDSFNCPDLSGKDAPMDHNKLRSEPNMDKNGNCIDPDEATRKHNDLSEADIDRDYIVVECENEHLSEALQKELFELGYSFNQYDDVISRKKLGIGYFEQDDLPVTDCEKDSIWFPNGEATTHHYPADRKKILGWAEKKINPVIEKFTINGEEVEITESKSGYTKYLQIGKQGLDVDSAMNKLDVICECLVEGTVKFLCQEIDKPTARELRDFIERETDEQ